MTDHGFVNRKEITLEPAKDKANDAASNNDQYITFKDPAVEPDHMQESNPDELIARYPQIKNTRIRICNCLFSYV